MKNFSTWLRFVAGVFGSFYVMMFLCIAVHELLGHGLMAYFFGANSFTLGMSPNLGGYMANNLPVDSIRHGFVRYAGIGVNAICGLIFFALLKFRKPPLTQKNLALYWAAVTHTGNALAYSILGITFRVGDFSQVSDAVPSIFLMPLLIALMLVFVGFAYWAIGAMLQFARVHFAVENKRQLLQVLLFGFLLPIVIFVCGARWIASNFLRLPWGFIAILFAVIAGVVVLRANHLFKLDERPEGKPITARAAFLWFSSAVGVFLLAFFWLSKGVQFSL